MREMILGGVSVLVGIGLAAATTIGVVNSATAGSFEPEDSVLEYGTNG